MTAIATTSDGRHLISGGGEGQVRVWAVSPMKQKMKEAMKEHKGKGKKMMLCFWVDEKVGCVPLQCWSLKWGEGRVEGR